MIESILVTDLSEAESYSFSTNKQYDVWLTAVDALDRKKVDRMRRNFFRKGVNFYAQFFADWSDEDGLKWQHLKDSAPNEKHIQNFIDFLKPVVQDDKPHNVGINCFAGISRSTALAIIALVMSGKTPDMALDYVLAIRPEAWPNLRMLGIASDILGKDIKTPVKDWKTRVLGEGNIITSYDDLRKLNK